MTLTPLEAVVRKGKGLQHQQRERFLVVSLQAVNAVYKLENVCVCVCYSHGLTTALGTGEEGEDVRMKETWQRIFGSPRSEGTDGGTITREATEVLRTKVIGQVTEWSSDWNASLLTPGPS